MKTEFCIEAELTPGNRLLPAVTEVLHRHVASPESFVWTVTPETNEARAWLHVCGDSAALDALLAELMTIPGVRHAGAHQPGQAIVAALKTLSDPPWSPETR